MRTVVKVGGAWLSTGPTTDELHALATMPGDVVVVHGGGDEISRWSDRLGLPVEWRDGLRVTRGDGMQLTSMVLSGWMNKRLASLLSEAGRPAMGVSGEDGPLLHASLKDEAAYGRVGEVERVEPRPVYALLRGGYTPVISPVGRGADGDPVNVNADEAAVGIALGLDADRLLLVSDVAGVLVDGTPIGTLDRETARALDDDVITGGMGVKVGRALAAAEAGIDVMIGNGDLLTRGTGTRVRAIVGVGGGAGAWAGTGSGA